MPASNDKKVMYQMLQFGDLSIAEASYSHVKGENLWLCQVIAIFSSSSQFRVVRWLRYQKTEADVPTVTTWDPIDIADVNGDGKPEIVLRGDAYEDHWFEVLGVNPDLSTNLLFSGLGYYL